MGAGQGVLVLAALLAGGRQGLEGWLLVGAGLTGMALAAAILLLYERMGSFWLHALPAFGTVVMGAVVAAARPAYAVLYLWSACFVCSFLSRRAAAGHLAWMVACLTVALLWPRPRSGPAELWILFVGTLVGAGILVAVVRAHLEAVIASRSRLLAQERRERQLVDVLFAAAPVGVVVFDRELRYVQVNETYARWLGREPGELAGLRLADVLPDIAAQVEPAMREMLRRGNPVTGVEAVGLGGRVFRSSRYPLRDEQGEIVGIAAIIDDVTAHKAAQAELERALAAEQETRALLGAILDHAPLGVFFLGPDLRYRLVNREVADTRGLPVDEIVGRKPEEVYAELAHQVVPALRRVLETGEPIVNEELQAEMPPGSGDVRHYLLSRYPVRKERGELLGIAAIRTDVTALKKTEAELARALASEREARALLDALVEHSPVAVVFVDRDLRYRLVNREAAESSGLAPEEMLGKRPEEAYPDLAAEIVPAMRRVLETGEPIVNEELRAEVPPGSGRVRHYLVSRYPVRTADGEILGVATVRTDVTRLKLLEGRLVELLRRERATREQVERAAATDALTGLANRPSFSARLGEALARARASGRAAALLFLDVDDFKGVNDTLGHAAGDALLRAVGARLKGAARQGDVVARVGGDELVILLADLDPEEAAETAKAVAARVRECFSHPFLLLGREVSVTASLGTALFPAEAADGEELLALADRRMYEAKRRRRGRAAA